MILTVTLNSALDIVIFIEEFIPTSDMRSQRMVESVGGKGFNSSMVLQSLGVPNLALGVVAGYNGQRLERLLARYGIRTDLLWAEGETRIGNVIVETRHHRMSHLMTPGYALTEANLAELTLRFCEHLPEADWVVVSGSLPQGVPADYYCRLAELAHQAGKPFLLDCSGEPLCRAAEGRAAILKMNRAELTEAFGVQAAGLPDLSEAMSQFRRERGLPAVVVTCGKDGILAATQTGEYLATGPVLKEVNSAGAGDAVSATLAWRLSLGEGWPEAMRWAVATSAAVVLTPGTADCDPADVARFLPETHVIELPVKGAK